MTTRNLSDADKPTSRVADRYSTDQASEVSTSGSGVVAGFEGLQPN